MSFRVVTGLLGWLWGDRGLWIMGAQWINLIARSAVSCVNLPGDFLALTSPRTKAMLGGRDLLERAWRFKRKSF